jgi:hypothetical protein
MDKDSCDFSATKSIVRQDYGFVYVPKLQAGREDGRWIDKRHS